MRQILTKKGQTVFDIAVQEYGNVEAVFLVLSDNDLRGKNELPSGYNMPWEADFDISYPIREGVTLNIQDYIDIENTIIANSLDSVISDGENIE